MANWETTAGQAEEDSFAQDCPATPYESSLQQIRTEQVSLEERLNTLARRLQPVLRNPYGNETEKLNALSRETAKETVESHSPMIKELDFVRNRTLDAQWIVGFLLDNLEI